MLDLKALCTRFYSELAVYRLAEIRQPRVGSDAEIGFLVLESDTTYTRRIETAQSEAHAIIHQLSSAKKEIDIGVKILDLFVVDLLKTNLHSRIIYHCKFDDE